MLGPIDVSNTDAWQLMYYERLVAMPDEQLLQHMSTSPEHEPEWFSQGGWACGRAVHVCVVCLLCTCGAGGMCACDMQCGVGGLFFSVPEADDKKKRLSSAYNTRAL